MHFAYFQPLAKKNKQVKIGGSANSVKHSPRRPKTRTPRKHHVECTLQGSNLPPLQS